LLVILLASWSLLAKQTIAFLFAISGHVLTAMPALLPPAGRKQPAARLWWHRNYFRRACGLEPQPREYNKGRAATAAATIAQKKGASGALFQYLRPQRLPPAEVSVFLAETIDAAAGVENFLLASVERMAVRAHLDMQLLAKRRARRKRVAATADNLHFGVFGMNVRFHDETLCGVRSLTPELGKGARFYPCFGPQASAGTNATVYMPAAARPYKA
jgi:hypothetical protein